MKNDLTDKIERLEAFEDRLKVRIQALFLLEWHWPVSLQP